MRDFIVDGKTYNCVEQYMMEQKALLFGDKATADKIMSTTDQQEMQDLGRQAKGYNSRIWNGSKQLIVYKAVYEKFKQNPDLARQLLSIGDALPVECAKTDSVWGIGMEMDDSRAEDPDKWNGENLLGFILKSVKNELHNG